MSFARLHSFGVATMFGGQHSEHDAAPMKLRDISAIDEPKVIDTYANQTDLAATLLNQMGLPTDEFSFSKDILNPCVPHYAFYTFNNGFGFIDESGVSVYDNEGNKILVEEPESGNETRLEKGKVLLQTLYDDLGNR